MKKQLVKLAKELAIGVLIINALCVIFGSCSLVFALFLTVVELFAAAVTTAVSLGLAMFIRRRL